jgi:hypothetical protein
MSLLLSLLQDGERCSARQFSDACPLFRAAGSVGDFLCSAASKETSPAEGKSKKLSDSELQRSPWWSKQRGGIGGGVHINDALPINPAPLIGGQNWYDNVCKIERLTS